jgi:hypothetical protein
MTEGPIPPIVPGKDKVTGPEPMPGPDQKIEEEAPTKKFDIGAGKGVETSTPQGISPADLPGQQAAQAAREVNPTSLQEQSGLLASKVEQFNKLLNEGTFNQLSDGQKGLLLTKAGQYAQQMQGISSLTGGKYKAPEIKSGDTATFEKVLGMLTSATNTLREGGGIGQLAEKKSMNTADMLRVQARILAADRTINFFTAVVGKFSDAIKTLGQTQI